MVEFQTAGAAMMAAQSAGPLKTTPLYRLHVDLGARMTAFAGYQMPLQYASGILKEHLHVRSSAGLFDVSHMGQLEVRARSGCQNDAAEALETLLPVDVIGLSPGRQRYALLTNAEGGISDDLMISNQGDRFLIVCNAAGKDADEVHLRAALSERCKIVRLDSRALLALQGPMAEQALAALVPKTAGMSFMDVCAANIGGAECVVSRSGYTGEDGFEIAVPAVIAETVARRLLSNPHVTMIGLGARDSLRLEAGLCLYGADLDPTTTPVEAAIEWSIQTTRRSGGARAGGFPGADKILEQLRSRAPRRRVGLRPEGRAPVRQGARLFSDPQSTDVIGVVTSGGFGPSVNAPIAMGYVATSAITDAALLYADLRGDRVPVRMTKLPFVPTKYKR